MPSTNRADALIEAAAELAQPRNPPASRRRKLATTTKRRLKRHSAGVEANDAQNAHGLHRRSTDEAIDGMLRSIRMPAEEVTVAPPYRRATDESISEAPADHAAAPPELPPDAILDASTQTELLQDRQEDSFNPLARAEAARYPEQPPSVDKKAVTVREMLDQSVEEISLSAVIDERPASVADLPPEEYPAARDALDEPEESIAHIVADSSSTPTALGERKRVIVACVRLDCKDVARAEAQRLLADIAYKLDGLVHEQENDRAVILFGLPIGHENDIVSAVRFAFDAYEALAHLEIDATGSGVRGRGLASARPPAAARIGIRAGTARLSGAPSKEGYQVLGNSIREAAALAEHADAGQILGAGFAARLAAPHYVLREAPALRRKGGSFRCHRVVRPRSGSRDRRADLGCLVIGREIEIRALRSSWHESVMRNEQRSVLVVGDPGIGKSQLVDEFAGRYCKDAQVITVSATPHRRDTPYSVIVDLLRAMAGVWGGRGRRTRDRLLERLRRVLTFGDPIDIEDTLDALGPVLDPGAFAVGDIDSGFARNRIYTALRELLSRVGGKTPVVVVIDDLNWADNSSLECLRALVGRPAEAACPLLVLMTMRPEEGVEAATLFEDDAVSLVQLDELDEKDRQRLIVNLLGERATDELIAEVERRAGGNPFFIRELCGAIKEFDAAPSENEIPTTVTGVIASRVDRLPKAVKVVLQYATVIGPSFREGILTRLLALNPARSLAELRNRGFLVPSVNMAVPYASNPGVSDQFERMWSFRHVLVQEVVYRAINGVERKALHRRVGDIMAKRAARGSSDPPAEVARHLELGGLGARAAQHYVQAASDAAAAYANTEALELFGRALTLADGSPDLQFEALAGRERIHGRLGMHDEQAAEIKAMKLLTRDDPRRIADLRTREARRLLRLGEFYRALEAAALAEEAAADAHDELLRGEALHLRGEAYGRLNDHPRAVDAVTQALEVFEAHGSIPHRVRARIGLGRIHLIQANYDEAFQHYDPALALIKESADRWQERVLRNNIAVIHLCRGDFSRALEQAEISRKLCEQFGDRAREGDNRSVIGIIHLELGLFDLARENLESALAVHGETGSQWSEADTLVYAGLLECAVGKHGRALKRLDAALAIAERIGAKYIAINARNAMALALCDRNQPGDAAKAVDEATEAFETARAASLPVGEIPGLSRAARATALLGDLEAARALSRRAMELLGEQKNIESAEEEIYYTHFRILDQLDESGAAEMIERAHAGFMGKMALLDDAIARDAYADNVRLNVAIRRDYRAKTG